MNFGSLLNGIRTLAIVCNQWGDSGKGKFVDLFADWADVIVRGTGGANAGHTISLDGVRYVFHLVPSGILHDSHGKTNVIGSGTVVDPGTLCEELEVLRKSNLPYNHLRISHKAKLILPQHLVMDRVKESAAGKGEKIGTTGRGIGPAYADHYQRVGLTMNDLLNPDTFVRKLERNLCDKVRILKTFDREVVKEVMWQPNLGSGRYYHDHHIFDLDAIIKDYLEYGRTLASLVQDTDTWLRDIVGHSRILLEGAQGTMLSVDHGSYPYVTASDCTVAGLANGSGLSESLVDLVFGIFKGPYMTRVGEGPFPTEFGGAEAAILTARAPNKAAEDALYPAVTVNDPDPFRQGVGIRRAGNEYGATTGRPRRCGWLDLPLLRYASQFNGPNVILTKPDVLDDCDTIRICTSYEYQGPTYQLGHITLAPGARLDVAVPDSFVLEHCQPIYESFPGWKCQIGHCRRIQDLPAALLFLVEDIVEKMAGVKVCLLSVGPDREQTVLMDI